ncbi:MAG: ribonuclease HII [Paracoccaceae bacterium]|nr:ribonuclease HII [Paracoccaceae bacterium]
MAESCPDRPGPNASGLVRVAGIDEAGRGPIAGPVVAAAVILPDHGIPDGIADSKTLPATTRERLCQQIVASAQTAVAVVDVVTIDRINILEATMLAMRTAACELRPRPELVLIDGPRIPDGLPMPGRAIIRGDASDVRIAAASIVAKVTRDRHMRDLAREFPDYGWDRNAGYPTASHLAALRQFGVSRHHRRTFRPVACLLSQ